MITTPYEKIQNDLRSIPKEQLMSMGNNPSPQYPTYMIATEMQRRVQEEKAMAAQQTRDQAGQPTVVEGVMDEFANTDGLSQAQPMMEMNQQMPQEGIQMMATGGRVGYQAGGATQITGKNINILRSLGISDDELKKRAYNIDGINNMARSDVTKLAEEIVKDRVSAMDEMFYPTRMSPTGEETIDVRSMIPTSGTTAGYGGGFAGFSNIGQDLISDSTTPTLFPTDEVEDTAAFRQDRGGIKGYFGERGAKTSNDIFNFIASNPQAFEIYNNAGGNANPMAGLEAVRQAGLLGDEADASQFSIANQQQRILKSSTSGQNAGLSQELDISKIPSKRTTTADLSTIAQILGVQEEIGTDTSGYDAFNAPDYSGLRRNESREDIYKGARDRLGLEDYRTDEVLTGLESMVDKLPVPDYEVPTERERQSELSGMGLAILGKAIGGARNLGEAAVTIGEGVPELGKLKKGQREEANAILAMDRAMAIEAANMKTALAGIDLQYKNADNTTKIQLEGIVTNEVARNDAFNEHLDTLKLNYDKMDFAHKELLANIGAKDRDAAIAIVKLDQLKTQAEKVAEGVYKKTLLATYDAMLTELEAIQDDLGETSGARIAQLNRNLDNTLSALLSNLDVGGSVGGQTLNPSDLTSMIANK